MNQQIAKCTLCKIEDKSEKHSYCVKCVRLKSKNRNLEKYKINPYKGYIYVITNPAWENWVKIGRALNLNKRIQCYNTSSPLRDYNLVYYTKISNPIIIERYFISKYGEENNEWFKISADDAIYQIKKIKDEYESENRR